MENTSWLDKRNPKSGRHFLDKLRDKNKIQSGGFGLTKIHSAPREETRTPVIYSEQNSFSIAGGCENASQ
jgi:hypothetical protein